MKILVLTNSDEGFYCFRKELLIRLIAEKHRIYVAVPYGERIEALKELGGYYINTPVDRRGTNIIKDGELLLRYFAILRKIQPDVVLSYTIKPNVYGGLLCRILNIAYIPNITGLGSAVENQGTLVKGIQLLYRLSLAKAVCVFFQNKANAKWMMKNGLIKGKYRLLPGSGVNVDEFQYQEYPDKNKAITFLFMGRIMKDKGIEELMDAAIYIKQKYPGTSFVLAGDCEENYTGRLRELTEKEAVIYVGFQLDVKPLLRDCFAVVHPSYHEGMSNVLLEASAAGRPVLASNIPGCREAFDEGVTGLGFEPRNAESLKEVLEKFILLPYEKKRMMGIEARRKMERQFDRKLVIDAYLDEINKISAEEKGHEPIRSVN